MTVIKHPDQINLDKERIYANLNSRSHFIIDGSQSKSLKAGVLVIP